MTWQELKEEAKKMGYNLFESVNYKVADWIATPNNDWSFESDGTIMNDGVVLATDRTPDQMLAIMKALQQEVDDE